MAANADGGRETDDTPLREAQPAPTAQPLSFAFGALAAELVGDLLEARPDRMDDAIHAAIARVGRAAGADRSYVIRLHDEGYFQNTHEWVADGIEPAIDMLQHVPREAFSHWDACLLAGECVHIPDLASMDASEPQKAFLEAQGIRSLIAAPMMQGGRLLGMIGFDAVNSLQRWRPQDERLLRLLADVIGAGLRRADVEAEVAAAQTRLQAVLDAMPDVVLEMSPEGRFTAVHSASSDLLLGRPESFLGRSIDEVLSPELAEIARRAMAGVDIHGRSTGHRYQVEIGGEGKWFDLSATALFPTRPDPGDSPGAVAPAEHGYLFVLRDITDVIAARTERERLGSVVENMTNLVTIADADGRIVWVNPAWETRTGLALADVAGRDLRTLLAHRSVDPDNTIALAEALATPGGVQTELRMRSAQGPQYWVDLKLRALRQDDGRVTGFVCVETEVTERKAVEQSLADIIRGAEVGTWEWHVLSGRNLINERWAAMLGYTREELGPLTIEVWERLAHPDDFREAARRLEQVFERRIEHFSYELRMRTKSGDWRWILSRGGSRAGRPMAGPR